MLDWDGQHLTVVLVVSAMMDENYVGRVAGWKEHSKKTPAQNSNCKEKIKRKHRAGECGEFSDLAIAKTRHMDD